MVKPLETVIERQGGPAAFVPPLGLLAALERLDQRLALAAATAQMLYGADGAGDPFRGLYVNADEVERLLAVPPGTPTLADDACAPEDGPATAGPAFAWLAD